MSLDQLGREDVGSQQELRTEDEQNKFVAGIIRRGLYKDGWKLVITGHSSPSPHPETTSYPHPETTYKFP